MLPALIRGDSVIVKPSLRGPITPVAFALLATEAGLPAGVVNIVHVRSGGRTIAQAERAHPRTNVSLHVLRGGGNILILGPDLDAGPDLDTIADAVTASVRINSAGGPFGLPLLALHADQVEQILPAVLDRLAGLVAAPLPTEPLRRRAVQRIENLIEQGASVATGGPSVPDDTAHRMSWWLPPTVLLLGDPDSPAARRERATVPLGPVLRVVRWTHGDSSPATTRRDSCFREPCRGPGRAAADDDSISQSGSTKPKGDLDGLRVRHR